LVHSWSELRASRMFTVSSRRSGNATGYAHMTNKAFDTAIEVVS
jgi:hypothetical protein